MRRGRVPCNPRPFYAVGPRCRNFEQAEDAEVVRLLGEARQMVQRGTAHANGTKLIRSVLLGVLISPGAGSALLKASARTRITWRGRTRRERLLPKLLPNS